MARTLEELPISVLYRDAEKESTELMTDVSTRTGVTTCANGVFPCVGFSMSFHILLMVEG